MPPQHPIQFIGPSFDELARGPLRSNQKRTVTRREQLRRYNSGGRRPFLSQYLPEKFRGS